jgi:hypothetical protein
MGWLVAAASALALTGCASVGTAQSGAAPIGTASGQSSVVASPPVGASAPVAASSPVDFGSETPLPMPTPSPGSEGTLPPMPPGGRPTDTAAPGNVDEAGVVIDVFAEEVEATAQNDPGYCNLALDPVHDGLKVWWHGTPSAAVLAVLDRARIARITPVVLPTKFPQALLGAASGRVVGQMGKLGISMVGVSVDCSGLDVGLVNDTAEGEAAVQGIAGAGIPVHFSQMADAVAL